MTMISSNGMSWEEIAKACFLAYRQAQTPSNIAVIDMTPWESLPENIRLAWEAAARQAFISASEYGNLIAEESITTDWKEWAARRRMIQKVDIES